LGITEHGGDQADSPEDPRSTGISGRPELGVGAPAPGDGGGPPFGEKGPFSPSRWKSPVRGPWLTSVFGLILLIGLPVEFVTGLISYAAYNPKLAANDPNPDHGLFGLYLFTWATSPPWLYRLTEGIHVMLGLVLVPVVLAKLWSVMPKLFAWPPWRSVAQFLERVSLVLIVGGAVFEISSGLLDINYSFPLNFYSGHFYGAWILMAGFAVHVGVKFGDMVRALRSRSLVAELRTGLADTRSEPPDGGLVAVEPAAPTISRRGILALVGGTSLAVFVLTIGETVGGTMRRFALFGTHYRSPDLGPNHFPVNHTAASAGITASDVGPGWRLELFGARHVSLSRAQLLAMPLTTADLPIACTEGWSTQQRWTGVPLGNLARLAGVENPGPSEIKALDAGGVTLSGSQVSAPDSMLALRVNGADLSLDHGFPARVIVPSAPGTHNLKWMTQILFSEDA
jgi:DMSO/TMAO reductase YedYZ molybdopterin-dependent catalytic subunit